MNALDAAIGNKADPTRELWAAAAVRERFRAGNLLAQWYANHAHADAETREAALLTSIAIQDLATPAQGSDGGDAFRLPTELRKRALEGFGAGLMRKAIDAVPEEDRTPVEQMLCTMLHGRRVAVDRQDRQQLTALRVATGCAVAAGVDPGGWTSCSPSAGRTCIGSSGANGICRRCANFGGRTPKESPSKARGEWASRCSSAGSSPTCSKAIRCSGRWPSSTWISIEGISRAGAPPRASTR
jgi:hypothetical protein